MCDWEDLGLEHYLVDEREVAGEVLGEVAKDDIVVEEAAVSDEDIDETTLYFFWRHDFRADNRLFMIFSDLDT